MVLGGRRITLDVAVGGCSDWGEVKASAGVL